MKKKFGRTNFRTSAGEGLSFYLCLKQVGGKGLPEEKNKDDLGKPFLSILKSYERTI